MMKYIFVLITQLYFCARIIWVYGLNVLIIQYLCY